ncbi:energy transducer TonB [Acinetobacter sp. AC1-2]|uniref:energy transducer TonB n=1 Tax=Acinetobacter sp. AC1-2 TaxID=2735132 RepID=UPI001D0E3B45|nr:energy transducer TonB [Acinetobacter sp. AC1-2]
MKILIKFILSFLFYFALNTYAQEAGNFRELRYQKVKWIQPPSISISNDELQGYDRNVVIAAETNISGKITAIKLMQSSGINSIDLKLITAVENARFSPYQENGVFYPVRFLQPFHLEASREPEFEVYPEIKVNDEDLYGKNRSVSIFTEADVNGTLTRSEIQKSSGLIKLDNFVLDEFRERAKFFPLNVNGKPYPIRKTVAYNFPSSITSSEAERYKKEYQLKIFKAWDVPPNSAGTSARVRVLLTDKGEVNQIIFLNEVSKEFKLSIERAIKKSIPFTLPENTDVRKIARNLSISFKAT